MSSPGSTCFPVAEFGGNWMNSTTTRPNGYGCFIGSDEPIETIQRMSRSYNASNFRRNYKSVDGRKTCICSNGSTYSWSDKCYDKIWVGVHGKESICMVTLMQDVDMTRVDPFYQRYCLNQQTMCSYASAIISEVECLPYDDKLRERLNQSIEKPFGVVSVIPCTVHEGSGHEASSTAEYDEGKASNFLRDKMKTNLAFTFDETVQTAISAFQHLCLKELKAEDIWVTTAWNVECISEHMRLPERKEHLAMISGGDGRPTTMIHMRRPFVAGPPSGTPFGEFGITNCGTPNLDIFKSLPYVGGGGGDGRPTTRSPFGEFGRTDSGPSSLDNFKSLPYVGGGGGDGRPTTVPYVVDRPSGSPFGKFTPTDYGTSNSDVFKSLPCVGGGGPTTAPYVVGRPSGSPFGEFGRTDSGPLNLDISKSLPCVGGGGPTTVPYVVDRPSGSAFGYFVPPDFFVPNVQYASWYVPKQ